GRPMPALRPRARRRRRRPRARATSAPGAPRPRAPSRERRLPTRAPARPRRAWPRSRGPRPGPPATAPRAPSRRPGGARRCRRRAVGLRDLVLLERLPGRVTRVGPGVDRQRAEPRVGRRLPVLRRRQHARRDQQDQLLPRALADRAAEEVPEDRDVAEERDLPL